MQVFADDGARLDVCVDGDAAAAVVLIHGFPLTRDVWEQQVAPLARTHRVLRPDLRGMGSSQQTEGPYLMETLAGDVAAMLDAAGVERAALVGHSMGGYVAMAFARMFYERVTHLALVCSRLRADTPEQASSRRELADRAERESSIEPIVEAYVSRLFSQKTRVERPESIDRTGDIARRNSAAGAAAMLRGLAMRTPADDIAPDVGVPVLVLSGGDDELLPLEEAENVARAFSRGRLVVCRESGHLPMVEQPRCVTEALEELLAAG